MIEGVAFDNGPYGKRATITGPWTPSVERTVVGGRVKDLVLNYALGWQGSDLSFLARVPPLVSLTLIDRLIESVEPVRLQSGLRQLTLSTYCDNAPAFGSSFPQLEAASVEWGRGVKPVLGISTLRTLFINGYSGASSDAFSRLDRLQSLALLNAKLTEIRGLSLMTDLRSLRLANLRRLESLDGIQGLVLLEDLRVDTCRMIETVDQVSALARLERLAFSDCGSIRSLKPIAALKALEVLAFDGTTRIEDGDLSVIAGLPKLNRVGFRNRKFYSHRREEFEAA